MLSAAVTFIVSARLALQLATRRRDIVLVHDPEAERKFLDDGINRK